MQLHCLPSQLDDEDWQDVTDFLTIMRLQETYGPKTETPSIP